MGTRVWECERPGDKGGRTAITDPELDFGGGAGLVVVGVADALQAAPAATGARAVEAAGGCTERGNTWELCENKGGAGSRLPNTGADANLGAAEMGSWGLRRRLDRQELDRR